mmetsp:Transcript_163617/g.524646  ORF Transcript_163617/g.524646 Transcript_163617/m.524646 type:complete len:261 (+) Transcript_163617:1066-1848(+)
MLGGYLCGDGIHLRLRALRPPPRQHLDPAPVGGRAPDRRRAEGCVARPWALSRVARRRSCCKLRILEGNGPAIRAWHSVSLRVHAHRPADGLGAAPVFCQSVLEHMRRAGATHLLRGEGSSKEAIGRRRLIAGRRWLERPLSERARRLGGPRSSRHDDRDAHDASGRGLAPRLGGDEGRQVLDVRASGGRGPVGAPRTCTRHALGLRSAFVATAACEAQLLDVFVASLCPGGNVGLALPPPGRPIEYAVLVGGNLGRILR